MKSIEILSYKDIKDFVKEVIERMVAPKIIEMQEKIDDLEIKIKDLQRIEYGRIEFEK